MPNLSRDQTRQLEKKLAEREKAKERRAWNAKRASDNIDASDSANNNEDAAATHASVNPPPPPIPQERAEESSPALVAAADGKRDRKPTGKSPDRVTRSCSQPTVPSGNAATAAPPSRYDERASDESDGSTTCDVHEPLRGTGMAWDVANEGSYEEKLVSYSESRVMDDLPQTNRGSTVVARAAQAFKDPGIETFPGYIAGQIDLPPTCIHADYSSLASVVFVVASCQPKELEFALAGPNESDAQLPPEAAQRFLLSSGDIFRAPAANRYRIENHSKTHECKLFWTMIRPAPEQDLRMEEVAPTSPRGQGSNAQT